MILMLPQQLVKQETPGWQLNFRLLSAVSLAGMILLGLLSEPNKDLAKEGACGVCSDLLMVDLQGMCYWGRRSDRIVSVRMRENMVLMLE
jgi:hypothetical protein